MSDVSAVVYFLGGGAVGAVATAVYTASHERAERFRERMLAAAESFLKAEEEAESAIGKAHDARRRQLEASGETFRALGALEDKEGHDEEEIAEVMVQSRKVVLALNRHIDLASDESREALSTAIGELRAAREEAQAHAGSRRSETDEYLDRVEVLAPRARDLLDAADAMSTAIADVANALPRLRILFARRGVDDPVMADAFEVARGLAAWGRAWPVVPLQPELEEALKDYASDDAEEPAQANEQRADPTAERDDAKDRAQTAVGRFAAHVSERIRQRSP